MRIKRKPTPKNKVQIWSSKPSVRHGAVFHGYIMRTPLYNTEFGNWGAVQYSILGKRYWSAGGRDVTLPISVINRLKEKGELK